MSNLSEHISSVQSGGRDKGGALKEGVLSIGAEHLDGNGGFNLAYNKLKYVSEKYFATMKSGIIQKNDILLVKDGATTGKVSFVDENFPFERAAINEHIFILRPDDSIYHKYLFYFLYSENGQKKVLSDFRGATVGGISRNFINMDTTIPPIEEQKKIAEILDKASNLISLRKQQIEKLDLLVKSRFVEMFGDPVSNDKRWEKGFCKDVTTKIGSGATPRGGNESYKEDGISLIRSLNVHNNEFTYKNLAFIDNDQALKLNNVIVEEDDILLNITGASVARCCIVPPVILPARVNQHVSIVRCKRGIVLPLFLCYQFTNDNYQKSLWNIATSGGATREAITKNQEENLEVILPPIELQNQFADFVQQVENQKLEMQQGLEKLEINYKALMQQYFG